MAYIDVSDVSEIANEFLDAQGNLTHFEALQLALQYFKIEVEAERNEILQTAFNVPADPHDRGKYPAALEAIAMQLGFKWPMYNQSLTDAIASLKNDE